MRLPQLCMCGMAVARRLCAEEQVRLRVRAGAEAGE